MEYFNNQEITAENLWKIIYEEIINNWDDYDVERFCKCTETAIPVLQKSFQQYKFYIAERIKDENEKEWFIKTCERVLKTVYNIPFIQFI